MISSSHESSVLATDSNSSQCSSTVLDVNELRERCLSNQSLVDQILSKLDATLQHERNRVENAWIRRDFSLIAAIAHRLKGSSANVGAKALRQAADRLELVARDERESETSQSLQQFNRQIQRLSDVLCKHRDD